MASRSRNSTAARGPRPLTGTRLLEALIGGWRPLARLDVEGFALLRSRGITRRANSAVALEVPADRDALEQAVSRVEALMQSAGARPPSASSGSTDPRQSWIPSWRAAATAPKATAGSWNGRWIRLACPPRIHRP